METLGSDADAVAAVRGGDAERYRELVERHERRVYAVAWSRLGDATLAEEATQEAFIRGYRALGKLGDGNKFSAWIAAITRNTAINLGLRHRRELNKRERWALETPEPMHATASDAQEFYTPETLRQTLAELPDAHRECLVLFYLEGKSGTEAATALGLTEIALRQRLHRARAALRERLESRLAESLEKLRPSRALAPLVMVVVLAPATSKAAAIGAGATTLGVLTKFAPLKFLSVFSAIAVLPALFVNWLITHLDFLNFRERDGFRARLFRKNSRRALLTSVVLIIAIWMFLPRLGPWLIHRHIDAKTILLLPAAMGLFTCVVTARRLVLNRNRYLISNALIHLAVVVFCLVAWFGGLSMTWIIGLMVCQGIIASLYHGERPLRTDYSLFLRAAEGTLPTLPDTSPHPSLHLSKNELFAFLRFLGSRWLVSDYRHTDNGVTLRLTPVKSSLGSLTHGFAWSLYWKASSRLTLDRNGLVTATLHPKDLRALRQFCEGSLPSTAALEKTVADAVTASWEKFRAGDVLTAERAIGQVPDTEVFLRPPGKSSSTRVQRVVMIAMAVVIALVLFQLHQLTRLFSGIKSQPPLARALQALAHATSPEKRFYTLGAAAKESFVAGKIDDARNYATELAALTPHYTNNWNYGNAIQDANLVLGRIAVREGNIELAKQHLLAAGRSPGSPQMNSFGPNVSLANDLLEKGERDTVLTYLMLCRKFWTSPAAPLEQWIQTIQDGKTPNFGANLVY